jgi:hypothetical protein
MGGFGRRPTLITRSPIAGSFGQLAFQDPVTCACDIHSSLGDFVLAVSDPTEREDNVVRGNTVLNELVSQQHRGLEVIEAETGGQDNGIADVRNLERSRHRMRWTVEHHKVVKLRYLERLRDRTEGFNRDVRLYAGALAALALAIGWIAATLWGLGVVS